MTLLERLAWRHAKDLWVPECKDGATQTREHRRIDGWAMLRTWCPPTVIGYEIKSARSDWMRDQKLGDYMRMCHLLYVVAEKGIVQPGELPDGMGLLEPLGADRLKAVRKAARRDGPIHEGVYQYILMCRAEIKAETGVDTRADRVRQYHQMMTDAKDVGESVSRIVSRRVSEERAKAAAAEARATRLEHIDARLCELGLDPTRPSSEWLLEQRLGAWAQRQRSQAATLTVIRDQIDAALASIGSPVETS